MASFEIRFLKDVCNDTGHQGCVVQRVVRLDALDEAQAREQACAQFCLHEKVGHWLDHADRLDVVKIDPAPRRGALG